jgi:hypothetical protein
MRCLMEFNLPHLPERYDDYVSSTFRQGRSVSSLSLLHHYETTLSGSCQLQHAVV